LLPCSYCRLSGRERLHKPTLGSHNARHAMWRVSVSAIAFGTALVRKVKGSELAESLRFIILLAPWRVKCARELRAYSRVCVLCASVRLLGARMCVFRRFESHAFKFQPRNCDAVGHVIALQPCTLEDLYCPQRQECTARLPRARAFALRIVTVCLSRVPVGAVCNMVQPQLA
jgi:hypothetical protein